MRARICRERGAMTSQYLYLEEWLGIMVMMKNATRHEGLSEASVGWR
jgi:hypothetical protein